MFQPRGIGLIAPIIILFVDVGCTWRRRTAVSGEGLSSIADIAAHQERVRSSHLIRLDP